MLANNCFFVLASYIRPVSKAVTMKVKVENIVATITLGQNLDLKHITKHLDGASKPPRFPGVVYKLIKPKVAMLLFRTGIVICSGALSKKDITSAVDKLIKELRKCRVRIKKKPIIKVQNIVASSDLSFNVNLDVLATNAFNTEYEPERFPGLVFRLDEPKTVMLIFRSGRIIITGAKTQTAAQTSAEKTQEMVKRNNAILTGLQ